MKIRGAIITITAILFVSSTAVIAEVKGEWAVGFDFGGDDLLTVGYMGGGTATIKAGNGFYAKAGMAMPLNAANDLELVGLLGWKFTSVVGSNGDATLSRFPLDLGVRYSLEQHRFNAGVTKDLSIDFSGTGVLSGYGLSLESKLGYALQYEYILASGFTVGARYNSLEYDAPDLNHTFDASSFGIFLSNSF